MFIIDERNFCLEVIAASRQDVGGLRKKSSAMSFCCWFVFILMEPSYLKVSFLGLFHLLSWTKITIFQGLTDLKALQDKPVRNSSLAKLFPVLSNVELNRMESQFLDEIKPGARFLISDFLSWVNSWVNLLGVGMRMHKFIQILKSGSHFWMWQRVTR